MENFNIIGSDQINISTFIVQVELEDENKDVTITVSDIWRAIENHREFEFTYDQYSGIDDVCSDNGVSLDELFTEVLETKF